MLTIDELNKFGANTKEGLERCVNMESLYLRLVKMVPSNEGFKNLYETIKSNDLDNAFIHAHSLKGILSNLSLTPLVEPINEITELLRSKTVMDYSSYLNKIEEERSKLEEICK